MIGFTVVLGGIISPWASTLLSDSKDKSSEKRTTIQNCSSISLEVIEADVENVTVQQVAGSGGVGELAVTWFYINDYEPLQSTMKITDPRGINSTNNTDNGFSSGNYRGNAKLDRIEVSPTGCPGAPELVWKPDSIP